MIVCHCRVVTDRDVRAALDAGAGSLGAVCRATGAGSVCGGCVFGVRAVIADHAVVEHAIVDHAIADRAIAAHAIAAHEAERPCPVHAVPALAAATVGSATTATTTRTITEETDAAPQPARRRVA